jgi:hypothetical protein
MRWIGTAAIVVGLALSAGLGGGPEAASARAKFVKCGKYDLGFTDAKVKSRGMRCQGAKDLFRKWEQTIDCPGNPCERARVENFVCRFGGSDLLVRLRCDHRSRDRAMKARWGG